jgi:hypothetical protein
MTLTTQQLQTLKTDIAADPVLSTLPQNADGAFAVAVEYNKPAVPNFYVWKTGVSTNELMAGQGFDWTRIDNLTVGKSRIWEFMTAIGFVNPALPNVRAGFEATFSVEAGDQSTRQAIYNQSQRLASRFEKLYATGLGTAATHHGVGPATMAVEGPLAYQDVQDAWALS